MRNCLSIISLRSFVYAQKGVKPVVLYNENIEGSLPYLDIQTLQTGKAKSFTLPSLGVLSSNNDILVVWDGSRSGFTLYGKDGIVGSTLMCLTPIELNRDYLYYFIKANYRLLNSNTTGTSIPHVNSDLFFNLEVPYFPLDAQAEIVREIQERLQQNYRILDRQGKAVNDYFDSSGLDFEQGPTVGNTIDNFLKSIIQAAVIGKILPGSENFNYNLNSEQIENWYIPDHWQFVSVGSVVESFSYGTSSKSLDSGIMPVLRMGNIKDNSISWENLKFTDNLNDIEKYSLEVGDVLFNRTNSPELVGKTAVFEDNRPAIYAGYLVKLKVNTKLIDPFYLSYCLNSNFARQYYNQVMVGSANQANVNATKLAELIIPLPPIESQKVIVNKVKQLNLHTNNLKHEYERSLELFEKLEDSILQEAFKVNHEELDEEFDTQNFIAVLEDQKEELVSRKKVYLKTILKARNDMKISLTSVPDLDIENILVGEAKDAKEVWLASKFRDDIDGFYEAVKGKVNNTISFELTETDSDTPKSMLSLIKSPNEN